MRAADARETLDHEPLVTAMGGGTLDIEAMLAIADLLPVMIGYVDRNCVYRFVNRPLAEWFELPRRQIVGRTMSEMLGDEAFAQRKPLLEAALDGERKFFASELSHPSRGLVAVQTDYVPWADPSGEVRGLIVLVTDVTEQRAVERALRESEERFRRIANSAPALMWVTRLDRVRDFVNDSYVDFVSGPGGKRDKAQSIDWRARIHPEDLDRIAAESLAGEASLRPFTLEGRYLRHDGEYRWLRSVSQPRFGADRQLSGFIGVATDITVAKEAEIELRRQVGERTGELAMSEARFRAVFDTVLEVLVLMDLEGTVIELNSKAAPWRAASTREAVGRKIWEGPTFALYPEHVRLMKRAVRTAAAGKIFTEQVRLDRDGVATAHIDISVQPVRGPDDDVLYLLFEARDVTDLKAAQEQLRQSQKMEALGQLTGGIAHDFNNLLTVVVGGLDIIAKRAEDDRVKRYAENALAAADRGARLTGQLLAFSRVQRLEVRPTHVAPIIQNMRPLLRNVLGPGITKEFDLDHEMMPVMADPTQLEVAVLNLAINARDAMPDGGVLRFVSRAVQVESDPELERGKYIELCISDTGVGMPAEILERAFEPFFTTKDVGKGTGLGLSMVYGMARQSGGTARIESAPGEGTSVKLYFRQALADGAGETAGSVADAPEADQDRRAGSVLVIDDDPDVRGFIVASLEEQGFKVSEAADGERGLEEIAREAPDLVVLDFIMPGLSGAEVASRILAGNPRQPILFVSGYSETEAVKRVAPDSPLLAKPFRADALAKAVRGALGPVG
ncbi:PAS domain S-box protein [Sphingomonas sp.]|uniref:PAS domain S-box protein n=1 Tax=Sphingomonas sp. TaxID=28214 RepID=UPI0025FD2BEF|nr:PAS domain S-box protein [Sphingomonas sp.]MBV9529179.1 PAS domain S-box protein [Sphingomonas sp.]